MLDHVSITVADLDRAAPVWDAVMAAPGASCVARDERRLGYGARNSAEDAAIPICRW